MAFSASISPHVWTQGLDDGDPRPRGHITSFSAAQTGHVVDMDLGLADDRLSPQGPQRPRPSHLPKKLKASCDICALSKVKCDRTKPACLRCTESGYPCHYSMSRRAGRIRKSHDPSSAQRAGGGSEDHRTGFFELPQSLLYDLHQGPTSPTIMFDPGLLRDQMGPGMHEPDGTLTDGTLTDGTLTDGTLTDGTLTDGTPTHAQFEDAVGRDTQELMSHQQPIGSVLRPGHSPGASSPGARTNNNCMRSALIALESLQVSAIECQPAESPGQQDGAHTPNATCFQSCEASEQAPASIDVILKTTEVAVDTVRRILLCSCASSCRVWFLLALVVQQALLSYKCLAEKTMQTSTTLEQARLGPVHDSASEAASSVGSDASRGSASIVDMQISIGAYVLRGDASKKAAIQILRSELEGLRDVFDSLASCIAEGEEGVQMGHARINFLESSRSVQNDVLQLLKY